MKTLLQSIWPYTENGVATRVWNYVLYHLPVFTTAVVMCSFNCLIALEAKHRPSNDSNFIARFMTCDITVISDHQKRLR